MNKSKKFMSSKELQCAVCDASFTAFYILNKQIMEQQNFINALFHLCEKEFYIETILQFRQYGCSKNRSNGKPTERHVRRVLERSQWKIMC